MLEESEEESQLSEENETFKNISIEESDLSYVGENSQVGVDENSSVIHIFDMNPTTSTPHTSKSAVNNKITKTPSSRKRKSDISESVTDVLQDITSAVKMISAPTPASTPVGNTGREKKVRKFSEYIYEELKALSDGVCEDVINDVLIMLINAKRGITEEGN